MRVTARLEHRRSRAVVGLAVLCVLAGCATEPVDPQPQPTGTPPPETTMTAHEAKVRAADIAEDFDHGLKVGTVRGRLHRLNSGDGVQECGWPGQLRIVYRYTIRPPVPDSKVQDVLAQTASGYTEKHFRVVSSTPTRLVLSRVADKFELRLTDTDPTLTVEVSSPCVWPDGTAPQASSPTHSAPASRPKDIPTDRPKSPVPSS